MGDTGTQIETPRLLLRPWQESEADRLFDIRRRPDVAKWLGDPTPWTERSTATDKIRSWHQTTLAPGPLGVWAITRVEASAESGLGSVNPLGSVSIGQLPDSDEIEIGWYLHPDSSGQGFAAEAAAALLNHAMAAGVAQVWAIMWPDNGPSARVARTIGMEELGVIDDPWYGTEAEPTSRIFRSRSPKAAAPSSRNLEQRLRWPS